MPRRDDEATLWLPGVEWAGAALAPEPADTQERRRALDPETSFIVQAPAGSGKTELLIQRFLVLLARVAKPESIVAITFTVKAAAEMRARVLDSLRNASRDVEPSTAHERFSFELAREALAQDARQGWNLLNNPDRLRIQTIDALSMGITRQMPWLSRFGAMPKVTDDARDMYRQAAERAVEMLSGADENAAAVACLLQHLDNDVARAIELLASMLETRDHWLRITGTGVDPAAVRKTLESSLQRIVCEHLTRLRNRVPAGCTLELLELLRYAAANVRDTAPVIAGCAGLESLPEARPDCLEHWLGLGQMMLTGKGEWRKRVDRSIGFPPSNKRMKGRFESLLASFACAEEFQALLSEVPDLPACAYEESQWEVLSALFRLLPVTVAHLRTVFAKTGQVDFVEIASAARRALGEAAEPTDLALAMGARIEHLLVDEFQDTSVAQFGLLLSLIAGEDDRGTVFLVGDPMQSIYRFRQAEVALFLNVRSFGIGARQPEPLSLAVNFRSARPVVEWVNQLFLGVFPSVPDAYSGAVPYTPSIAFREGNAGAGVTVYPFVGRDDQAEANLIVDLIQRTQREWPENRTAILVRSRSHLAVIANCLRDREVRYRAIEIQALAERPVIQDLLALTRALLHLGDRLAWLSILRAPWCGLTLTDMHRIAGSDRERPIWSLLQDVSLAVDPDCVARLARVTPILARGLAARGRVPVAQLVERTWIALGGDELVDDNELGDARAFFDLLEEAGKDGDIHDLELLSSRARELFANPGAGADGAVELMTIHKAKGLEFDTVILPGLGKRPKVDDSALLLWSERPHPTGTDLLMAPISARRGGDDRTYDFIRRENDEKTRHEAQRLLYVACTRAKSRLHLIGHLEPTAAEPPRDSLLAHMWGAVQPQFEELLKASAIPAQTLATPARTPRMLTRVRLNGLPIELAPSDETADRPARIPSHAHGAATETGTTTHRLLERIAREGLVEWTPERIAALRPFLRITLGKSECDRVQSALSRTLADPIGRWALSPQSDAQSEFAITGVIDGEVRHLAIDRTFVAEDGVRWIIDFKTSDPEGGDVDAFLASERREYQAQLQRYAEVLAAMDTRKIRVGLYFPMVSRWVEWDPFI